MWRTFLVVLPIETPIQKWVESLKHVQIAGNSGVLSCLCSQEPIDPISSHFHVQWYVGSLQLTRGVYTIVIGKHYKSERVDYHFPRTLAVKHLSIIHYWLEIWPPRQKSCSWVSWCLKEFQCAWFLRQQVSSWSLLHMLFSHLLKLYVGEHQDIFSKRKSEVWE